MRGVDTWRIAGPLALLALVGAVATAAAAQGSAGAGVGAAAPAPSAVGTATAAGGASGEVVTTGPAAPADPAASAARGTRRAAPSQGRPVTLELHEAPLREALDEVARQSGVALLYSADVVPLARRVTVRVREVSAPAALRAVLAGTGVAVRRAATGELMLVRAERAHPAVQPGAVRGRVTDSTSGAPVAGASVALEGTRLVVVTDDAGAYRLAGVEAGTYVLSVRRLGYASRTARVTVVAGEEATVDLALAPAAGVLDQVVVTGSMIPTAIKAIPTPITVVTDSQIAQQYLRRTDQIFRQFVPGVISWDLGLTAPVQNSIAARGASSLLAAFNTPKMYIDGIESSNATFTTIDPSSIARVEIVRGPEAATLYGSDAMGGVIQVFTKRGAPGLTRPHVDASVSLGSIESQFKDGATTRQAYSFAVNGGSESAGYTLGGTYTRIGAWLPDYFLTSPSLYGGVRIASGGFTVDVSGRSYTMSNGFANNPKMVAIGAYDPAPLYEEAVYRQETWGADVQYVARSWWRHELTLGIDRFGTDDHNTRPRETTPADTFLLVNDGERRRASIRYNTSVTVPVASRANATVTAGIDHSALIETGYVAYAATNLSGTISSDPNSPAYPNRSLTQNTGYFGQLQLAIDDALFATVGVRAESNTSFGDEVGTLTSPRVGLTYVRDVGGTTLKLRGSYGDAIRAPLAAWKQYTRTPYYTQLANPALRPERQRGGDIGIDLVGGARWSIGVTYYDQTAADLLQLVVADATADVPTFHFENIGRIRNNGLELEGALHLSKVDL
ncbi:MAG TPA: TonB-dependent receptor, partial [Gemmatimonadaceae bacterium]|nr:TonB-dependent receptor [Gemmatimonadaceae bacterium]